MRGGLRTSFDHSAPLTLSPDAGERGPDSPNQYQVSDLVFAQPLGRRWRGFIRDSPLLLFGNTIGGWPTQAVSFDAPGTDLG